MYSDATARGALLVLVRTEETRVPAEALAAARALWDLVTAHGDRMAAEAVPGVLGQSRAAAAARATAIAELVDAHGAALSALLGVLRGRDLDDRTARARAVDLAVGALAELRARTDRDQALVEERPVTPSPGSPNRSARSCAACPYGWTSARPAPRRARTGCSPPTWPIRRARWCGPWCTPC
ncbi:hypothetical protein ACFQ10_05755 [Streptomyces indonesiensis]